MANVLPGTPVPFRGTTLLNKGINRHRTLHPLFKTDALCTHYNFINVGTDLVEFSVDNGVSWIPVPAGDTYDDDASFTGDFCVRSTDATKTVDYSVVLDVA